MKIAVKKKSHKYRGKCSGGGSTRKQGSLQSFPECHNRGAITYDSGKGVPKSRSISVISNVTIFPVDTVNVEKKVSRRRNVGCWASQLNTAQETL